ncbi:MAG: molybdopterin-dependent oxidoreductase FAD-binding subunit [Anaerolineales bacterium]
MITDYHRPTTLEEALTYLQRPNALPLGGGTLLSQPGTASVEVVDLQALGLNRLQRKGETLEIGATVTLQELHDAPDTPEALREAIALEAPLNLRNAATVAGALVACDGRSPFACALLALDAKIEQAILDHSKVEYRVSNIGEFLPLRSTKLITQITIPLNAKFAFEYVARTPSDKPIVCAALTQWNSGRTRLSLGGWGQSPTLAMDGVQADDLQAAARNACHEAADEFASAEYRCEMAAVLAKRCLEALGSQPL